MENQAFWSYLSGAIAGMGSAVGAYLFFHAGDVEWGSFGAVLAGIVSAGLAIAVGRRKLVTPRRWLCVAGFITPPALYFAPPAFLFF